MEVGGWAFRRLARCDGRLQSAHSGAMPRFLLVLLAALLVADISPARAPDATKPVTAFVGISLIPDYGEAPRANQTVLVRGERVVATGPAARIRVPRGARMLGHRGQIVAPGLADMHVHIFEPNDGVLFLANGVTTVRNMAGRADTDALAARIEAGENPGPHIYSSGPIIDGPREPTTLDVMDEVRRRVNATADRHYIAAKLYENLAPDVFAGAVAEARRRGLQVYAHVPLSMGVRDVLALRIDSIEHLTGFDRALAPQSRSAWDQERWAATDASLMAPLAHDVANSGVWNTATLVTWFAAERAFAHIEAAEHAPLYRYATPRLRRHWRGLYEQARQEHDPARAWDLAQRGHRARLAMVKALHEAGAGLLIGTDATQPFLYPGFSLQDELALHRDAGIPVRDILRAATRDAARFLRREPEFGRIVPGARADLVLLDQDPAMKLEALRSPAGVMAAGRWYDAATLRRMLDEVAARNAAGS
jgi:imidazolonepropionase-like amidohydrolase